MTEGRAVVRAPLLSAGEAARYLGVGRLIEEGRLAVVRAGGATRVERRDLDDFRSAGELT
ncbi:MAG: helix-turn-helix domain-containing protein [Deferrisomatales bacterium]|nr:helix-turn-helix domain-containing protein [Deferrisomatales bacterium]